jgi:hypothetical protein
MTETTKRTATLTIARRTGDGVETVYVHVWGALGRTAMTTPKIVGIDRERSRWALDDGRTLYVDEDRVTNADTGEETEIGDDQLTEMMFDFIDAHEGTPEADYMRWVLTDGFRNVDEEN